MLGCTYYANYSKRFFFFSLQNELLSLLNIVKQEMDVHNSTLF